jgi:hypothetical protein
MILKQRTMKRRPAGFELESKRSSGGENKSENCECRFIPATSAPSLLREVTRHGAGESRFGLKCEYTEILH